MKKFLLALLFFVIGVGLAGCECLCGQKKLAEELPPPPPAVVKPAPEPLPPPQPAPPPKKDRN
jgi:hypothetical protein